MPVRPLTAVCLSSCDLLLPYCTATFYTIGSTIWKKLLKFLWYRISMDFIISPYDLFDVQKLIASYSVLIIGHIQLGVLIL